MVTPRTPPPSGAPDPDLYLHAHALLAACTATSAQLTHLQSLCLCVTSHLGLLGTVVRLIPQGGDAGLVVAATIGTEALGELEVTAGEGPAAAAHRNRRPVLASDLAGRDGAAWPGFTLAAAEHGIGAVYALPLAVGAARLGTLEAFAADAHHLTQQQVVLLLTFAEIATELVLDGDPAHDGARRPEVMRALGHRSEIAQAQGMTMIDLDVDLPAALAALRAHAFAEGLSLLDLSRRVIAGYRLPTTTPEQP